MPARAPRPPMGVATKKTLINKRIYAKYLDAFKKGKITDIENAVKSIFAPQAQIDAFHPVNITTGASGYFSKKR